MAATSGTTRTRRTRLGAVAAAGLAAGVLLAGCSGGSTVTSPPDQAPADSGTVQTVPEGAATGGDAAARGGSLDGVAVDRSLVVTATTTVRTDDVLGATAQTLDVARRYDALVVQQSTSTGEDPGPVPVPMAETSPDCATGAPGCAVTRPPVGYSSSTITLRVAPDDVDPLLADVAALGSVLQVTRDVADVTAQVADVDARVKSAEASLARIRALLAKAEDIGDIVALEAELSTRQANLESLQAQQRALADATAMATVTVMLVDPRAPAPEEPATGFLAGLQRGWDAFTSALAVGMTLLGALVPFLVLLLVVLIPALLITRHLTRRRRAAVAAASEDPEPVSAP